MDRMEVDKAILEYLRHMATLTGTSIGVLTGFAEKFAQLPGGSVYARNALIAFLLSLLLNVVAYSISLFCFFGRQGFRSRRIGWAFAICAVLSIILMFVGFAIVVGSAAVDRSPG